MASDQHICECPYCGKWTYCEAEELEEDYPEIICEYCGDYIDVVGLDINIKVVTEEEAADGE
jgi:hypothetical protein